MLRWILPLAVAILPLDLASGADLAGSGAPIYGKTPRHGRIVQVEQDSDLLFTPSPETPYVHIPPHTPLMLGATTLPGYYGSTHTYEYQGPYYGGPNINYRYQLPYACSVLGYC